MFIRDVLQRLRARRGHAVPEGAVAAPCAEGTSLLGELAADPEDFVELAAVLGLDVRIVIDALTADQPPETADDLVATLATCRSTCAATAAALGAAVTPAGAWVTAARGNWSTWGAGGEVGGERWGRARGGARTQRNGVETKRAMVTS